MHTTAVPAPATTKEIRQVIVASSVGTMIG